MPSIEIIIGSTSDQKAVKDSGMFTIFKDIGVSCQLSAISAHRHPEDLAKHCQDTLEETCVYIGIAGMSAALPGAIAATTNRLTLVLGVALSSEKHPEYFAAARESMTCMPPGVPLAYMGSDKPGLINAALYACQIIAIKNQFVAGELQTWLKKHTKPTQIGIQVSDDSQ